MTRQLAFDWPARVALGEEDFFVTDANRAAFEMVSAPERWPAGKLALIGPTGAGKTHLARLFAERSGAEMRLAPELTGAEPMPNGPALIIEEAEGLPIAAEEWLFHAHNALMARPGGRLLLTATEPPSRWSLTLPDLASRMQATTLAYIDDPDDRLLAAVLMKQFEDRQLAPGPEVLSYLTRRMDRSFAAARRIVAALDAASLAQGRTITVPLAREVLDGLDDPAP